MLLWPATAAAATEELIAEDGADTGTDTGATAGGAGAGAGGSGTAAGSCSPYTTTHTYIHTYMEYAICVSEKDIHTYKDTIDMDMLSDRVIGQVVRRAG